MGAAARVSATVLSIVLVAGLTACGSSGGSGPTNPAAPSAGQPSAGHPKSTAPAHAAGASVSGPCDVTDRSTVAAVFAGAGAGSPGAVRNCKYALPSGPIGAVNVFYYGSSSEWDVQKAQATRYTGPLEELSIGDGAYYAAKGGGAVTVRKGAIIFAVQVLPTTLPTTTFFAAHEAQVEQLATRIAAQH